MSTDPAFKGTRALVIDSNKTLLDGTVRQLVELGVSQVLPCRELARARQALEKLHFDFVLCADELEGSDLSGQTLLEQLRRDSVLSHTTAFVMMANKATYLSVMEAAEAALDSLLLRPFRASDLSDRLTAARQRRLALSPIFEALNQGLVDQAIVLCQTQAARGGRYAELCHRMAAELLLKNDQADEALTLFRELAQAEPAPSWARLGVARSLMARGDLGGSKREITALLELEPQLPDALDVLGRVQVEQGDLSAALDAYRRALQVTPHCILRLQHGGTLAFYANEGDQALEWLDRARSMDKQSSLFDTMTLTLLALLQHDRQDSRGLAQASTALQQYLQRFPNSKRLLRMNDAVKALQCLGQDRRDDAMAAAQRLAGQATSEDFDFEAATVLLAMWVRLPQREVSAAQQQELVGRLAQRFCVTRATTAVLLSATRQSDTVTEQVRSTYADIALKAEDAMQLALAGQAGEAIESLLAHGQRSWNSRLLGLASQLLRRHGEGLPQAQAQALADRLMPLQALHCRPISHIAGMRRTGRDSGGLMVRVKAPTVPAAAVAPAAPAVAAPPTTPAQVKADAAP